MIRVIIGDAERELSSVDPQWVNEQINRRRAAGVPVCVKVLIKGNLVNLALATPGCSSSGGGVGRTLNSEEQGIVALWESLHLNTEGFAGGNLIAFLKQIT
jgi:hypothetical protein